jgi:hypothetical protein
VTLLRMRVACLEEGGGWKAEGKALSEGGGGEEPPSPEKRGLKAPVPVRPRDTCTRK